jgi:hypothetical protein
MVNVPEEHVLSSYRWIYLFLNWLNTSSHKYLLRNEQIRQSCMGPCVQNSVHMHKKPRDMLFLRIGKVRYYREYPQKQVEA